MPSSDIDYRFFCPFRAPPLLVRIRSTGVLLTTRMRIPAFFQVLLLPYRGSFYSTTCFPHKSADFFARLVSPDKVALKLAKKNQKGTLHTSRFTSAFDSRLSWCRCHQLSPVFGDTSRVPVPHSRKSILSSWSVSLAAAAALLVKFRKEEEALQGFFLFPPSVLLPQNAQSAPNLPKMSAKLPKA